MRLAEFQEYAIPATQIGRLVGLLISDNLAEYFMLHVEVEQSLRKEHAWAPGYTKQNRDVTANA